MTYAPIPPEWREPADRPSELKDPVLTVRQLSRFGYTARRPPTSIDHALVFATDKNLYEAYPPPARPRRGDVAGKRYTAVYEVDMGLHPVRLELSLPSAVDAFRFEAVADLIWRVTEPVDVITSGVRDVPALLGPRLGRILRRASRHHRIDMVPEAETAVQERFDNAPQLAAAEGLWVGCTVRLHTDQGERSQSERLRTARHDAVASAPEHRVRIDRLRRDLEAEEHAQKVAAQKIEFYEYHLSKGGFAALVIHLVQHPDDTALVVKNLREDQTELIKNQLHLVDQILGEHGLEGYQMETPKNYVVETINRVLAQSSPAAPPTATVPTVPSSATTAPVPPSPAAGRPAEERKAIPSGPGAGTESEVRP